MIKDSSQSKYELNKDVFSKVIDSEAILLHLSQSNYYGLNTTATHIWNQIQAKKSKKEIMEDLQNNFDLTLEVAEKDLNDFLQDLIEENLIQQCSK